MRLAKFESWTPKGQKVASEYIIKGSLRGCKIR